MPPKTAKKKSSVSHRHHKPDRHKQAHIFCRKTHFIQDEVELLLRKMDTYSAGSPKGFNRDKFRDEILYKCFGMTDDLLMDRVFKVLDKDNDTYLNDEEYINAMSVLLRGTENEKIEFCFSVYDVNNDKYISREEMFLLLKCCLVQQQTEDQDPEEGIKDIVEMVLRLLDEDKDSRVSLADFKASVKAESLLLEAVGTCLPSSEKIEHFMKEELIRDIPKETLKKQYPMLYKKMLDEEEEEKEKAKKN